MSCIRPEGRLLTFRMSLSSKSPRREETGSLALDHAEALSRVSTYHAVEFSKTAPPAGYARKRPPARRPPKKSIPLYQLRSKASPVVSRVDSYVRSRFRQPAHDSNDRLTVKKRET